MKKHTNMPVPENGGRKYARLSRHEICARFAFDIGALNEKGAFSLTAGNERDEKDRRARARNIQTFSPTDDDSDTLICIWKR